MNMNKHVGPIFFNVINPKDQNLHIYSFRASADTYFNLLRMYLPIPCSTSALIIYEPRLRRFVDGSAASASLALAESW